MPGAQHPNFPRESGGPLNPTHLSGNATRYNGMGSSAFSRQTHKNPLHGEAMEGTLILQSERTGVPARVPPGCG